MHLTQGVPPSGGSLQVNMPRRDAILIHDHANINGCYNHTGQEHLRRYPTLRAQEVIMYACARTADTTDSDELSSDRGANLGNAGPSVCHSSCHVLCDLIRGVIVSRAKPMNSLFLLVRHQIASSRHVGSRCGDWRLVFIGWLSCSH